MHPRKRLETEFYETDQHQNIEAYPNPSQKTAKYSPVSDSFALGTPSSGGAITNSAKMRIFDLGRR